jgi:single-strand DNA-binding protein
MSGFNKVILMGRLTRNPELRFTPSGTPVASFGLAVSRRFKQNGELKEEVTFTDIVVFGKQAEHCGQYLKKGSGVLTEGRLQQRRWETEDGQKRSKHEIVAQTVTFLPKTTRNSNPDQPGDEGMGHGAPETEHDGHELDQEEAAA